MRLRLTQIAIISTFFLMSCSSMYIRVVSEPEQAEVYLKEGKKQRKLGVTPLKLNTDQLGSGERFNLFIVKDGFQGENLLLEERSLSAQVEVFSSLQKLPDIKDNSRGLASVEESNQQRALASIQAQLVQTNYSQAEILSRTFVNQNPFSPVGWSLLGNSYLLQNRNSEALQAYQKALELDPNNQDTKRIVNLLQQGPIRRER